MAIKRPVCVILTRRSNPTEDEISLPEQYPGYTHKFRANTFVQGVEPGAACYAGERNEIYDAAKIPRVEDYKPPEKTVSATRKGGKSKAATTRVKPPAQAAALPGADNTPAPGAQPVTAPQGAPQPTQQSGTATAWNHAAKK